MSCMVVLVLSLLIARSPDVRSERAPAEPTFVEVPTLPADDETVPVAYGVCPQQYPVIPPYSFGAPSQAVAWHHYPSLDGDADWDFLWKARYEVYQQLITYWSRTSLPPEGIEATAPEGKLIALLHGRNDVLDNAALILEIAPAYPEVPPILVAASIAQQASDIERAFGVDLLEQIALNFPGLDDMSIGIAQLRPTETESLGLGDVDLFDPEDAIHGMFTKIRMSGARIDALQSHTSPVPATDRAMLMSLAQNSPPAVGAYFRAGGDWDIVRAQGNHERVMRYFLVHLDWLVESGWELPAGVDLERWRAIAFSAPGRARDVGVTWWVE
jgi:hypothetical protein